MPFNYSCFISYRHGQKQLAERIITDLSEALHNELELWMDEQPYVDKERLKGGDHYNELLASALCQSVCMIVVFTPRYFDRKAPFCAREYRAMEKIENIRLEVLKQKKALKPEEWQHGFIIPIVFRGVEYLPDEVKSRQYYDFSDFLLSSVDISRHPDYSAKVREIAKYIKDRYEAFRAAADDPCNFCEGFALPTEEDISSWLDEVCAPRQAFVMRELT